MSQAVSMYSRSRKSRDTVPWAANEMQEMRVATPPLYPHGFCYDALSYDGIMVWGQPSNHPSQPAYTDRKPQGSFKDILKKETFYRRKNISNIKQTYNM